MGMAEKTSLTKTGVQGSSEDDASLKGQGKDRLNASGKDERGVDWENRAKEFEGKYNTVAEKLDTVQSRLEELEEKDRLSTAEKEEKAKLEKKEDSLEKELEIFNTDSQFRAAREYINRNSEKIKSEASQETLQKFYTQQVNRMVNKEARSRNLDPKKFRTELLEVLSAKDMEIEDPIERTEIAIEKWDKLHPKKDENSESFAEGSGRSARETSFEDAKKKGDLSAMIKAQGL